MSDNQTWAGWLRKRCSTCAFSRPIADTPTRVQCTHDATPALLAGDNWPSVFYADSCGYWRAVEKGSKP